VDTTGENAELSLLAGRRVVAFCGIGNPAGFRHTLAATGCDIVAWCEFSDHHAYRDEDVAELARTVRRSNAELVVCTHKDLVKLKQRELGTRPMWALAIEIVFLSGREAFEERVRAASNLRSGVGQSTDNRQLTPDT
jgi:tetraacyldisaccharide 4'-kinase